MNDRQLVKEARARGIEAQSYQLILNGHRVRKATKVVFPDGKEVKFIDSISSARAIRRALEHRGWETEHFNNEAVPVRADIITVADGYNGDLIDLYVKPIAHDGDMLKLRCAEPGKEYMVRWIRCADWESAVRP